MIISVHFGNIKETTVWSALRAGIFSFDIPLSRRIFCKFEKASILYSTFRSDYISISTNHEVNQISAGDANDGFSGEVEYFAACMENDVKPLLCTPESALQTIRICFDHLNVR